MPQKISSFFLAGLLLLTACTNQQSSEKQTLTIFAASSLIDVFNELSTAFEAQHPDAEVQLQYAGSSQLAIQITQGAPVDVFASANATQMQIVVDEDLAQDTPLIFANNQLVLIVPVDNPADIQAFRDIGQGGVSIVTAVEGVPIRVYTDTLLNNLVADATYGTEFRNNFYDNIRSEEINVRQVVLKIALGEADAAIVYRTDITSEVSDQLEIIKIPQEFAPQPMYFVTVVKSGENSEVAQDFVAFIMSEQGQAILEKYGFKGATSSAASATTSPAPLD